MYSEGITIIHYTYTIPIGYITEKSIEKQNYFNNAQKPFKGLLFLLYGLTLGLGKRPKIEHIEEKGVKQEKLFFHDIGFVDDVDG